MLYSKLTIGKMACVFSILLAALSIVSLGHADAVNGKEKDKPKVKEDKAITGTVETIRDNYISILLPRDPGSTEDTEMVLPIDENVVFDRAELSELKEGDVVSVSNEEEYEVEEDGSKKFKKRKPKTIKFLRSESNSLKSKMK